MTNLDDLMEVWQSQNAAPLHGVNETLLRLALRHDEAKLQKERRRDRWIIYLISAGSFVGMVLFFALMYHSYSGRRQTTDPARDVNTGWDLVIPIVGAAAAVIWGGAMYVTHRAQERREQQFGESLRGQLGRRIAQLDYRATSAVRLASVLALYLPMWICTMAILIAGFRVNHKPISEDGFLLVYCVVMTLWFVVAGVWEERRQVRRNVLPRKRQLEALLKELDDQ